jgi:peptide deformylase
MALSIAQLGQPVLRVVTNPVPKEEIATARFQRLIDEMIDTLAKVDGFGLAAPQVFVNDRLFVARVQHNTHNVDVFINPIITTKKDDRKSDWEGCLSFPELQVLVPRHCSIRVEYLDRHGIAGALDLDGLAARVVQHELDHLDGILTLDRAASTRDIIKTTEFAAAFLSRPHAVM